MYESLNENQMQFIMDQVQAICFHEKQKWVTFQLKVFSKASKTNLQKNRETSNLFIFRIYHHQMNYLYTPRHII